MNNKLNLVELIKYIDPSRLDYQEWINVGMALKQEGYSEYDWDSWSSRDSSRYHSGECHKKWATFNGSSSPITGGTIYQMACDFGYKPPVGAPDEAMNWDDEISNDPLKVIDDGFEIEELKLPKEWHPKEQLIKYLSVLFEADDNVGYVTDCWQTADGKNLPTKGNYDRTAGQLIEELSKLKDDDIGAVFGDYNKDVGAWIRFNPLDGKGVKNDNVTDYRYALVESDEIPIETQNTIIRELELPVACLVHTGNKSIHAIVKINATNYEEYSKRVNYLYKVCDKNGFITDKQNKNPSRLSRMPGVERKGKKQYLLDTNIGKESWDEWYEWIESINDDLPEPENLTEVFDNLPELSPPLIDNVLRQGHKMLIAGPSKAGKSFALIELTIAIAEGKKWLGFNCTKGRVMYVNLELDKASCLHRFADVYKKLNWQPNAIKNIDIWHLRGKASPMDKLAPKLIRRALKKNYIAVIIDPIYKVLTGDENSAEQMSKFCNQFDKICAELGCAVIYCHHHSKGNQGTKKSMDRASGSGVFARDPDAMLDLIELEIDDNLIKYQENKAECAIYYKYLKRFVSDIDEEVSQDDLESSYNMEKIAENKLSKNTLALARAEFQEERKSIKTRSAWRIEGTLREFPRFSPINCWFNYPIHQIDDTGVLSDIDSSSQMNSKNSNYKKNFGNKKSAEERKNERKESLEVAFSAVQENSQASIEDLASYIGQSEKTIRRKLKEHGGFWIDNGNTGLKNNSN